MVHTIWSNLNTDEALTVSPGVSEEELLQKVISENLAQLAEQRRKLSIKTPGQIIRIGRVAFNGEIITTVHALDFNISECLFTTEKYAEWFVDSRGDLVARVLHSGDWNVYTYRMMNNGFLTSYLTKKITDGCSRQYLTAHTKRLGDYIAPVYGWKIPRQKQVTITRPGQGNRGYIAGQGNGGYIV